MFNVVKHVKAALIGGALLVGFGAAAASAATVTVDMQFFRGESAKKDPVWTMAFSYDSSAPTDRQLGFADLLSFTLSVASGRTLTLADLISVPGAFFGYHAGDGAFQDVGKGQVPWLSFNATEQGGGMLLTHQGGSWHLTDFSLPKGEERKQTANKLAMSSTTTPSPVPLPVPGLLLLAGLGGLLVLRPRGATRAPAAA